MSAYSLKDIIINCREKFPVNNLWTKHRSLLQLNLHTGESSLDGFIEESGLHRPGLAMVGFTEVYSYNQVQLIGHTEWNYLESLGAKRRREIFFGLDKFTSPLWMVTHGQKPHKELFEMCVRNKIPLFSTTLHTFEFSHLFQRILEEFFAPYSVIHASLVDVYGVGMLYVGESNVGKSECVLDLVERGHRLVADDVVHISKIGNSIIGRANPMVKHHMEIRGVGIIDIRSMFGIHAVRKFKKIEVIVELQQWDRNTTYDRTGLTSSIEEVMGVKIPHVLIPVLPGKNLTVISEVIAMNSLMKIDGVDTASNFNELLLKKIKEKEKNKEKSFIDDEFLDDSFFSSNAYE